MMRSGAVTGSGRRAAAVLIMLAPALAAACGGNGPAGVSGTRTLVAISGDSQRAIPGAPLADSVTAMAIGPGGGPQPGVAVDWSGTGDAKVSPGIDTTNDAGVVRARVTLGTAFGPYTIIASSPGYQPAHFGATAVTPGTPSIAGGAGATSRGIRRP